MTGERERTGIFFMRAMRLLLVFFIGISSTMARSESNEYNIKAMFVLNFIKYIEWPDNNNQDIFRIGVIGESAIYDALLSMTKSRPENRNIKIEKLTPESKEKYRILIISREENRRIEDLVKMVQTKGVLLISDECKSKNCAAINLRNINNKIRFEIFTNQAHEQGIKISSKLTDLALTVYP
jgi:hypothetical protein